MTLRGYFDESARKEKGAAICVAGYIFTPGSYRRFSRDWKKFLKTARPGGILFSHMTDLYAGKEQYEGLKEEKGEILGRAVGRINAHILAGVAVIFSQDEFESIAPAGYAYVQGSIYSTACQICMRAATYWLEEHGSKQLVAYTFESGYRFESEANAILNRVAMVPSAKDTHRYASHLFASKETTAGLQAADILAWILARAKAGFPNNHTMRSFIPHILALVEHSPKYRIQVLTGESLRRFFAEQDDRPDDYYFKKPAEMKGRLR